MKVFESALTDAEVAVRIKDVLFDRGEASLTFDRQRDEAPFEVVLQEAKELDGRDWDRLERISLRLVEESQAWPVEQQHFLLTLIEEAAFKAAIPLLRRWAESGAMLKTEQGAIRHQMVLRSLLGLGWRGSPPFWLEQSRALEGRFPELIFRALLGHGLDFAFIHLPRLVSSGDHIDRILRLFPELVETASMVELQLAFRRAKPRLPPVLRHSIETWLTDRSAYPEEPDDDAFVSYAAARWGRTEPRSEVRQSEAVHRTESHLAAEIAHLPPIMQHVVQLRVAGRPYAEIAETLKISSEKVRELLAAAREELRKKGEVENLS